MKKSNIGSAYAVWTGIGAAGTFLLGIAFFSDPAGLCVSSPSSSSPPESWA